MIYLASPYSGTVWEMGVRFDATENAVAQLLKQRYWVYSPIVHCHALAVKHDLPKDAQFWYEYNIDMLWRADELWVLTLDGWEQSKGIRGEVAHWTLGMGRPLITYISPDHLSHPEHARTVCIGA